MNRSAEPVRDGVVVLAHNAECHAEAIRRLATETIPLLVCTTVEGAVAAGAGQTIVLGTPDLVAEALPSMPDVRWVQSTWAGVRPLARLRREGLVVTGVKGVFGQQIAEYCIGYLLAHELGILERAASQRKRRWDDRKSGMLAGKTAGVMGTGSIGRDVARLLAVAGVRVLGLSRSGRAVDGFERVARPTALHAFLCDLDYLIGILPDTDETRHLIDAHALAALPPHAFFINVGRGSLVDEAALVAALEARQLAGAALDVFAEEPLPAASPLWNAPNLLVTAHIAAHSIPERIVPLFLDNYRRYRTGQPLLHVVDPELGY